MEGLEIVEVKLSGIINYRVEAEHYQKKYSRLINKINRINTLPLRELVSKKIQTGHTPSMKNPLYYGGNIHFIKTNNLRIDYLKEPFTDCITLSGNDCILGTTLQTNDIITTIIGATYEIIARSCLITSDILPANINQNIAQIRINTQKISPEYVVCYLNSKYGRMYLEYLSRQSEQVNLNCEEVGILPIPIIPSLIKEVTQIVQKAYNLRHLSKTNYKRASEIINSILETTYTPVIPTTAEKSLRESFIKTGRIDAEYYQPKYEHIEGEIKDGVLGCWHLTDGMIADANYNPESDFLYHYIELSDIGHSGEITGYTEATGDELPTRARRAVQTDDVLLSYLEGSLTSCALIDKNHAGCLCSNGFYVLRDLPIRPEVMLVLLKSDTIQQLLHKGCSGHIMASISKDELEKIAFPTLDDQTQAQIAALIRESFALRDEANQLLSDARQLVEDTIENA